MKVLSVICLSLSLVSLNHANAKTKPKKDDLTADKIVEASREPNNTGWVELHGPGPSSKRFFRFKDGSNTCYALIDGHMGAVALDCK